MRFLVNLTCLVVALLTLGTAAGALSERLLPSAPAEPNLERLVSLHRAHCRLCEEHHLTVEDLVRSDGKLPCSTPFQQVRGSPQISPEPQPYHRPVLQIQQDSNRGG